MTYSNPTPPFRSLITEILTPCLKTFEYNNMQESNSKYKTVICRHFTDKGYCSMKEKCHFAHGEKELRFASDPVPSNISVQLKPVSIYKTQLCKVGLSLFSITLRGIVRMRRSARMPTGRGISRACLWSLQGRINRCWLLSLSTAPLLCTPCTWFP